MKFVLLIGRERNAPPVEPAAMAGVVETHVRVSRELAAAGKLIASERLRPDTEAVRVREKGGRPHHTDGPFAETKEVVGGVYLIDCASRDEAAQWAEKLPIPAGAYRAEREFLAGRLRECREMPG